MAQDKELLGKYTLALADDELIIGHRNSEWCGHAPILEEDIAFANIALDEIGHAILWYQAHARFCDENDETYPDTLVYHRSFQEFRNTHIAGMPNKDWAFTIVRQFLFDSYERIHLDAMVKMPPTMLAEIAEKIRREEVYHLLHSQTWIRRLGLGTEESNRRVQNALEMVWPFTKQMFYPTTEVHTLVSRGLVPDPGKLWDDWKAKVIPYLVSSGLSIPKTEPLNLNREDQPDHMKTLVEELQEVVRQYPDESW